MTNEIKTEHPYICYRKTAAGMEPCIVGTGIAVRYVVAQYRHFGTVEGVLSAYPHLRHCQVHDALSYFYDHVEEIEGFLECNEERAWQ
ncbi:MAG: DUF433 domain-containing protein [Dehalococcoidia bacterium]|nr:DUF433 domain-containing protein [Dehalococcoidia bacterium]